MSNFLESKALFCEVRKMTMVEKANDIVAGLLIVKVSDSARIFSRLLIGRERDIIMGSLAIQFIEPTRMSPF